MKPTLTELKALAFDTDMQIKFLAQRLQQIHQQIATWKEPVEETTDSTENPPI